MFKNLCQRKKKKKKKITRIILSLVARVLVQFIDCNNLHIYIISLLGVRLVECLINFSYVGNETMGKSAMHMESLK